MLGVHQSSEGSTTGRHRPKKGEHEYQSIICKDGCAWSPDDDGYRCFDALSSPCGKFDSFGACVDDVAIVCDEGNLKEQACNACESCGRSGSGYVTCDVRFETE